MKHSERPEEIYSERHFDIEVSTDTLSGEATPLISFLPPSQWVNSKTKKFAPLGANFFFEE